MLRTVLIAIGAALLLAAAVGIVIGNPGVVLSCGVWGLLLLFGLLYERVRYKRLEAAPLGRNWAITSERFIDDETGKPVTVYVDPASGERKYVTPDPPAT